MATRLSGNSFRALASETSLGDGPHLADDSVCAFAFYNVGIQNSELLGQKWNSASSPKKRKLRDDIRSTFGAEHGIQALFICEFGGMEPNIDKQVTGLTKNVFEDLLREIEFEHLVIEALPPYVAIVDPEYWQMVDVIKCDNLCAFQNYFAMRVILQHTESGARVGVANCHIPTSITTTESKKTDIIDALCDQLATLDNLPSWIIGGDFNLKESVVKKTCHPYLEPQVPSISRSGVDMRFERKADFAVARGINLREVRSWVGYSFPQHASDAHNMVPVIGTLRHSAPTVAAAAASDRSLSPAPEVAPTVAAAAGSDRSHVASDDAAVNELLDELSDRAADEDETASDLLDTLLSCHDTRAVKSTQQILTFFAEVLKRRNNYIDMVSLDRGVAQPARWGNYSREQWRSWLQEHSFSDTDMDDILSRWKQDFEDNDLIQTEKVEKWRKENTRESKRKARDLVNGAWKTHLTVAYGPSGRQLALAFLKCPPAMVNTLLRQWREYMESPQYTQERDRARPDRTEENKRSEVEAKGKVNKLRHQRRFCRSLRKKQSEGTLLEVPKPQQELYTRFLDGSLDEELDEAIRIHGYGTLSTGERIGAFGPWFGFHDSQNG